MPEVSRITAPARLRGIFVGRAAELGPGRVASGFVKLMVPGSAVASVDGLAGDEQADRKVHGGPDMAIYAYPFRHYDIWAQEYPEHEALWQAGGLGENLSIDGWDEQNACIGDIVRLGTTLLQVTRPRKPCFKLALRFNDLRLPRRLVEAGRCGWYYRVLQSGIIGPADTAELVSRLHPGWTIRRVNDLSIPGNGETRDLEQLAALPELAANWRTQVIALVRSAAAAKSAQTFRPFRIIATQAESQTIRSLHLAPVDGGGITTGMAGQHVVVRMTDAAGASRLRSYSLSGVGNAPHLQISVKHQPGGAISSRLHLNMEVGDCVELLGPRGNFTYAGSDDTPLALISAGVGITPMMPMLAAATTNNGGRVVPRSVLFLHATRNSNDHAFAAQIGEIAAKHPAVTRHVRFSRPGPLDRLGATHQSVGRIDKALIESLLRPLGACSAYICGPSGFMANVQAWITQLDLPVQMNTESFGGANAGSRDSEPGDGADEASVVFDRSHSVTKWRRGGATLLELAEATGLQLDSECQSGLCGSCATRIVSGRVAYDVEPVASVAPGEVLLCCGHPIDAELVLDI